MLNIRSATRLRTTTAEPAVTEPGGPPAPPGVLTRLVRNRALRAIALLALVLLDLVIPVTYARQWEMVLPTFHLDGAFQTASGLFRLSSGQWPGKDFFPYLGIGPVLTLFPAFVLRGSTLAASVFSARLMSLIALQLIFGVVATLVFRRRSAWVFAWAAAVPMLLIHAASVWQHLSTVDSNCGGCLGLVAVAGDPGNSLRPIRAFAPYLLAGLAYLVLRSGRTLRTRLLVVGASAGVVAAVWSNDYGLVSGGLLLVVVSLHLLRTPGERRLVPLLMTWGAAGVAFVVSGFAATAGHFLSYLSYNFGDVRGDQFWYFAPWAQSAHVYSLGDLLRIMSDENAIYPLIVLVAISSYALVRRDLGFLLLSYSGAALLLGGVTATVAGHAGRYFWALVLWGYVVTAALAVWLVTELISAVGRRTSPRVRSRVGAAVQAALGVLVVVLLVLADAPTVSDERQAARALATNPAFTFQPTLGGYLDSRYDAHLDLFSGTSPAPLEEYMGLAGALRGPNTDLPVDSVIAALGGQRAAFAAEMARHPRVVVTTAPDLSEWVTWNLSANWWFYRTLFRSYSPELTSPTTLVWRPTTAATWAAVPCRVQGSAVEVDAPSAGLYEVTLHYRGPGQNARAFSMVQNNINVAADGDGFVALDPGATMQQLPVVVNQTTSGSTRLPLKDVPAGHTPLTTLTSCSASAVSPPPGARTNDLFARIFRTPVNLTDVNWTSGVSKAQAGFFVPNTTGNYADLQHATAVRFSDGEVRRITRVVRNELYIDVTLEGAPLDPSIAGFPHRFELVP